MAEPFGSLAPVDSQGVTDPYDMSAIVQAINGSYIKPFCDGNYGQAIEEAQARGQWNGYPRLEDASGEWFKELVGFAALLQNKDYVFYASN